MSASSSATPTSSPLLRAIAIVIAIAAMITVNVLANALPINGMTTGALSDRFDTLFKPAGYVFSIWSLIYAGLIAFAIYQLLPAARARPRVRELDGAILLSCLANGSWIVAWHHELIAVAMGLMLVLLGSLLWIYRSLGRQRSQLTTAERWCVDLPFSVYLAWISVAALANASILLADLGLLDASAWSVAWFIVALTIVLAAAALVAAKRGDLSYLAVVVWALVGIGVAQQEQLWIVVAAAVVVALVLGMGVAVALRGRPLQVPAVAAS